MDLESGSSHAPSLKDDEEKPADDKATSVSGSGLGSPPSIKKGLGLKRWKRIPRDVSKIGTSSNSSGKVSIEELPDPPPNPTKRGSSYAEKQKKSETSLSPPTDAGVSSENGQEQTISSPASVTSGFKINYEIPLVVGSSHDKGRTRSGGKNSGRSRIQTMKKHRGKESSPVLSSGVHSSSNGIQSHLDGENGDDFSDTMDQFSDAIETKAGIFPEDEVTVSSPEVQNVSNENQGSHEDQDPLAEVMFELQTVHEALAKEIFMLTEVGKDAGESEPDASGAEWADMGKELHGDGSFSQALELEVEWSNIDLGAESEDLFRKSIEADVVYTATSGAANELRSFTFTQVTASEEQKNNVSIHTITREELASENMHLKEAMKLEKISEDTHKAKEKWKTQKTLWKLALCAFIQLVLLLVIIRELVSRSSPGDGNVVPT